MPKKPKSGRVLVLERLEEGKSVNSDYAAEHLEIKNFAVVIKRIKDKYPELEETSIKGKMGKPIKSYSLPFLL